MESLIAMGMVQLRACTLAKSPPVESLRVLRNYAGKIQRSGFPLSLWEAILITFLAPFSTLTHVPRYSSFHHFHDHLSNSCKTLHSIDGGPWRMHFTIFRTTSSRVASPPAFVCVVYLSPVPCLEC
ncbi:hypothetical protein C8F01DRAFT_1248018 [Mycena amicta]|nr:hypothetical protein C8F01DRAFT_1248018 [Mycena amicta]